MPVLAAPRKPLDMPCMHDPLGQHGICSECEKSALLIRVDAVYRAMVASGVASSASDIDDPMFKSLGLALVDAGDGDTVTISKVRYEALRALAKDGI